MADHLEGYRFLHVGVVDLKFPKGFGTPAEWASATTRLLHDHGFNGAGAWSGPSCCAPARNRSRTR